ncbi:MAG: alpha/beta hydrolase [Verrucomicrobiota bacterium]
MNPRRRKLLLIAGATAALAFAGLNLVAYRHARAMCQFARGGERTLPPEKLSFTQKAGVLLGGVTLPRPENRRTPEDEGLAFTAIRFPGARQQQIEAWHIRHEQGRGIVLLFPGYGAAKDSLLPVAKKFHELGWDALLVDFHGCGGSGGSTTSIGWHEAADVAQAHAWAKLLARDKPVVHYGVSLGAVAILRAVAADGVKPDAIIAECPFDRMLNTVKNRFRAMGVPSFPSAQLLVFWGGRQQGFDAFTHNPMDYAQGVKCPVLQLHGARDPRVSEAEARRVFEQLRGPKEFVLLEGVGHESYLAARPQEWQRAVEPFLNARTAQPPERVRADK